MFRTFLCAIFVLTISKGVAQSSPTRAGIVFNNQNWQTVSALAAKTHRYIFVDAYTSWCGPCKALKETTFRDASVAAYFNTHFVNFGADMEKGEGLQLSENWKITAYPTLLFFNPDGQLVLMKTGFVNAGQLIALAKEALSKK